MKHNKIRTFYKSVTNASELNLALIALVLALACLVLAISLLNPFHFPQPTLVSPLGDPPLRLVGDIKIKAIHEAFSP